MKTTGNLILMTTICVVIFWVFMAIRPAPAQTFFPGPGNIGRFHGYTSSPVPQSRLTRAQEACVLRACPGGRGCIRPITPCLGKR